ncbi:MAG: LPD38 domain-containing protein [Patescibacteria group bacterium]
MPLDPQVLASIANVPQPEAPKLDAQVLDSVNKTEGTIERRRQYLRDKYVWGLVAPLTGTRTTYSKRAIQEVTDPIERQWLVEEVARVARMQEWAQRKAYGESGYAGRFAKNLQKVGGSFAEAGTGMLEAASGLRDWAQGKGRSAEDVRFLDAIESAKQAENPYIPKEMVLAGKAATGAAGMAPDLAAGLLANVAGGPAGMAGYWTARQTPERREGYLALGLGPTAASLAGVATAGAEAGIELLNIDPTGLTKPVAAPVKGALRRGLVKAAEKIGGKALKSFAKHPVARRAVGAGVEALKRTGLETAEEGLQGLVQEGGKYLAGKATDSPIAPAATEVFTEAYNQMAQAAPGVAVLGGVGGVAKAGEAVSRYKKFAAGAKRSKIEADIIQYAQEDKAPSRAKWQAWGLPSEEGKSVQQRKDAVQRLASQYQAIEQIRTAVSGVTPTEEQWKQWGFPAEEGKTEEQRREYLSRSIQPQQPAQEPATPPSAAGEPNVAAGQMPPLGESEAIQEGLQAAQGMAPSRHDFPVEMEGTGEQIGGREVVRQIEQIWGIPIRSGRMGTGKGTRGIYKLKSHVSRLAKGEESSAAVAVHEVIGHHLDNTTDVRKSAPAEVQNELGHLDYDEEKARNSEGFAEFLRAYMTGATERFKQGIDLKVEAPNFLAHFEQWLDKHQEVKAKIEASRKPLEAFKKAGAVGRVKGQISDTGIDKTAVPPIMERVNEWKEFFYTKIKEEGRPIKRFTDEARKRGYDPGGDATPFEAFNALRQIGPHFAANAIENGVFRLTGNMEKIGPSLSEALDGIGVGDDYINFIAWAYARHAIESWSKGKNPGVTLDDAQEVYKRLYDPRYEAAADKVTAFNNALIEVLVDVGAIGREDADKILAQYEHYLPLERAKEGTRGGGGRKMVDLSAAIKGRRGSGLQIIDPMESTLARAIRLYERAAKQVVVNKLVEVSQGVKGLGGWIEAVPTKVLATTFGIDEIKGQLASAIEDSFGIDPSDFLDAIDPMAALTVWRPDLAKVHGQPIVRVTIDGKAKFFQLRPELAEALGGLETLQNLGIATEIAKHFCGTLKIGATRFNPDFILSNAFRDFQTFLMQGEKGLKGAFDPARYATAYVVSEMRRASGEKGVPVVEMFQRMGGELSTYTGLDRNRLRAGVRRALSKKQGKLATALNIAGTPEVASRLAEFASVLQREGWLAEVEAGKTPPMPVLIRAISAAHDVTVDFRRMGSWGRYLNYWVPFINARLEGLDKFVRTFKDHPERSLYRVTQLSLLGMLYWWFRHKDDDYRERPEWQDQFFVFTDTDGKPTYRIPKSQEWGALESGVERMLDALYDKDPAAMERWGKQVFQAVTPGIYPAGITPLFETMFNYDLNRQRPVVSVALQKFENPDQYYESTSGLVKSVTKFLHEYSGGRISLSPAKIDHLVNGFTGSLYRKVTEPIEKAISGESWSISDVPGLKGVTLKKDYSKSVDDLYREEESLSKAHESAKLRGKPDKSEQRLRTLQSVTALMTEMRGSVEELSGKDRDSAGLAIIGLARAALGKELLARYPNPIANPDSLPDPVRQVVMDHIAKRASTASHKGRRSQGDADAAASYLTDLGVQGESVGQAVYRRLRSQGIRSEVARERAEWVEKRLRQ